MYDYIKNNISIYHGVDLSKNLIKSFKQRIGEELNNEVYLHNMEIKEFCKNYINFFDKAFIIDFTEHVNDKQLIEILESVKNSINSKGEIIIHTPNANFFIEKLKKHNIIKQYPGHIAVRSLNEYKCLFNLVGLDIKSYTYLSHYNFKLKYFHLLSFLPLIGKYFRARLLIKGTK